MVLTEVGRSGIAMVMGGYGLIPGWIGIGSGSGLTTINTTGLIHEVDRNALTGSPDTSTLKQVNYTVDFNSVEMSGIPLTEFGLFNIASGGNLWVKEGFAAITFDGTNELQIQVRFCFV